MKPACHNGFKRTYTVADIGLLASIDERHGQPSGAVLKKLCERACQRFGQTEYQRLAGALGSLIYGFMPTEFVARVASDSNPLAIPVAAVIGIPLYLRAEAVIPLSAALAAKGMGLGVMVLIIGSAGASLTEVILLKSIFKNPMIIAFLLMIFGMAISAGYLYAQLF